MPEKVDRRTAWEVQPVTALAGVFKVTRLDEQGRRVVVYDNWSSLTEKQAKAICYALNVVEAKEYGEI